MLYADDTNLYVAGSDNFLIQTQLQQCLDQTYAWCNTNKFIINIGKTKSIFFNRDDLKNQWN